MVTDWKDKNYNSLKPYNQRDIDTGLKLLSNECKNRAHIFEILVEEMPDAIDLPETPEEFFGINRFPRYHDNKFPRYTK